MHVKTKSQCSTQIYPFKSWNLFDVPQISSPQVLDTSYNKKHYQPSQTTDEWLIGHYVFTHSSHHSQDRRGDDWCSSQRRKAELFTRPTWTDGRGPRCTARDMTTRWWRRDSTIVRLLRPTQQSVKYSHSHYTSCLGLSNPHTLQHTDKRDVANDTPHQTRCMHTVLSPRYEKMKKSQLLLYDLLWICLIHNKFSPALHRKFTTCCCSSSVFRCLIPLSDSLSGRNWWKLLRPVVCLADVSAISAIFSALW